MTAEMVISATQWDRLLALKNLQKDVLVVITSEGTHHYVYQNDRDHSGEVSEQSDSDRLAGMSTIEPKPRQSLASQSSQANDQNARHSDLNEEIKHEEEDCFPAIKLFNGRRFVPLQHHGNAGGQNPGQCEKHRQQRARSDCRDTADEQPLPGEQTPSGQPTTRPDWRTEFQIEGSTRFDPPRGDSRAKDLQHSADPQY